MRNKNPLSARGSAESALDHAKKLIGVDNNCPTFGHSPYANDYPVILRNEAEADKYIKANIRVYVESWILAPLIRLNQKLNPKKETT